MRAGFALEYSLGHTTHAQNLKRYVASDTEIEPTWVDVVFNDSDDFVSRLPLVRSNWSVRASLKSYRSLKTVAGSLDAALFHTQVTALFSTRFMKRVPSVISLDATPVQFDALGSLYGHKAGGVFIERLKKRLNSRAFKSAAMLVSWSEWTKQSLISDYGVPASKITVIPPGIEIEAWQGRDRNIDRPLSILFVGGDFVRKGGVQLLQAFQSITSSNRLSLQVVTRRGAVPDGIEGVTVHQGIEPNSIELRTLYEQADLFVLPTLADCMPIAVMEAMSAGKPIITTDVGALTEMVTDGELGFVVPAGDVRALSGAILRLTSDETLRHTMGKRSREIAVARFDAAANYKKLIDVMRSVAR